MKLHGHGLVALADSERKFLSNVSGGPVTEVISVEALEALVLTIRPNRGDGSQPLAELAALLIADMASEGRALTYGGRA